MKNLGFGFVLSAIVCAASAEVVGAGQCASTVRYRQAVSHQQKDIVDTAVAAGQFKTLAAALGAADLVEALKGEGPFTVFAPTDAAFGKLPDGTVEGLLKPENQSKLVSILKYHVVSGNVTASQVVKLSSAGTLNGQRVGIQVENGKVKINESNVVKADIACSNGVIHVIDSVLLPPKKASVSAADAKRMIEHAIHRGVGLYNSGHHGACAEVYSEVAHQLLQHGGDDMPPMMMTKLRATLDSASATDCSSSKAWTLRHGLDSAYASLSYAR